MSLTGTKHQHVVGDTVSHDLSHRRGPRVSLHFTDPFTLIRRHANAATVPPPLTHVTGAVSLG
ncbi:hypothetical protein CCHR01_04062 [Colletotrichum chrysophilum]|uniref:Uncharacterized protein n=1 Tax=Colletotrichum chrysophilum TaxID=1836956 RepID=A0AAD9ARQ2_9PEZI|nr:hypothetical protein K456DRAFT_55748 [Colletotrichum gloeosporioides 23]KAK1853326.1 hypothetical protein CCHR01_04062 [Colletotrichum chrysophilum]